MSVYPPQATSFVLAARYFMDDSLESVCLVVGGFFLIVVLFLIHFLSEDEMKVNAIIALLKHHLGSTYTQ